PGDGPLVSVQGKAREFIHDHQNSVYDLVDLHLRDLVETLFFLNAGRTLFDRLVVVNVEFLFEFYRHFTVSLMFLQNWIHIQGMKKPPPRCSDGGLVSW